MKHYKNNIPRLFVEESLIINSSITISRDQAHYLVNVMRKKIGDLIRLFNGADGEWIGEILIADKKTTIIRILEQTRKQLTEPDIILIFSPIKNTRIGFLIEKATELGVKSFLPITTEYSAISKINVEKLRLIAIEAAEQSERLSIPQFFNLQSLGVLISNWEKESHILLCDEMKTGKSIGSFLPNLNKNSSYAIMVGPEGGFSSKEREKLSNFSFITSISLGPRILRSETAVIAALSCFQSVIGDWNS